MFLFGIGVFFGVVALICLLTAWAIESGEPLMGTVLFAALSFFSFKKSQQVNTVTNEVVVEEKFNLGDYMSEVFSNINWWWVGGIFAAYVLVGILWATWKWYRLSLARAAEYKERKKSSPNVSADGYIPRVKENKGRIIGWMAFWPLNAPYDIIVYLIRDLLVDFWNQIYKSIAAWFTSITRNTFGEDYIDDNKDN